MYPKPCFYKSIIYRLSWKKQKAVGESRGETADSKRKRKKFKAFLIIHLRKQSTLSGEIKICWSLETRQEKMQLLYHEQSKCDQHLQLLCEILWSECSTAVIVRTNHLCSQWTNNTIGSHWIPSYQNQSVTFLRAASLHRKMSHLLFEFGSH